MIPNNLPKSKETQEIARVLLDAMRLRQEVASHNDEVAASKKNSDELQARIKSLLGK